MAGLRSFVERTVHLQLQHLTSFRAPIPMIAVLIVFTSLPIVGHASSASVSALATSLGKALTKPYHPTTRSIPLLTTLFNTFVRSLTTTCLRVRIRVKIPIQWWQTFTRGQAYSQKYDTYATPHEEAKYWRMAGRYRRRLYSGNSATSVPPITTSSSASHDRTAVPLVTYYTPRLLPLYRDGKRKSRDADMDARESWISPKAFCKWHRMVFQNTRHPTLAQAAVQMKHYSNRDLREIQRIARLVPDEHVFRPKGKGARKAKLTTRYSDMWKRWLENKGVDVVIVFE